MRLNIFIKINILDDSEVLFELSCYVQIEFVFKLSSKYISLWNKKKSFV